ncbi:monovalent cation/H+ antiporter complex subunit F [Nocardiopsis sp. FIRDI 009]|uniref:monovalent cation/H+ antiporter complex subunit F n=1 Tax=Nocardiopsis sp. FIRDI 009 TaxID=714197 RepID=UPI000E22FBFB|nr:monovalent cation/H+ antiporter complex subunit F [Nocardiopsis sp. FIRDI 009]
MTVLWIAIAVLLGLAALLSTARLMLGPSILDRALSVDVLVASALTGIGAYAAVNRDPSVLPILLVLSLIGFVSSVSVSKFVARRHLGEHLRGSAAGGREGPGGAAGADGRGRNA